MPRSHTQLPWLEPGDAFPDPSCAWSQSEAVPGLLAAGGALDVLTLRNAYSQAIFPWFSPGQPILWWSPDPRMVLDVKAFRLHRSLRKTLGRFVAAPGCELRIDTAFSQVIGACAAAQRPGQHGTWIVPPMVRAYTELHRAGLAHSVETWADGALVGGLYCVGIGQAVFGESMFASRTDASKIALAALVAFCRFHGMEAIDCQQNTRHLHSLGACEWERARFVSHVARASRLPGPEWKFRDLYWNALLNSPLSPL